MAANAQANPSPTAVAPAQKAQSRSFSSRAHALLAEHNAAEKENNSPATSGGKSGGGSSPSDSPALSSAGAKRRGASATGASRRFGGCMSPPMADETDAQEPPISADAAAAPASATAAAAPVSQAQPNAAATDAAAAAAADTVQDTPVRNLAAPFRLAVLPEGQPVVSADSPAKQLAEETPAAKGAMNTKKAGPSTPSSSPGRKGWVARLGFLTLRLGVMPQSRSP